MTSYIFHGFPSKKRGETLMPLNILKNVYPDIYEHEVAKYQGRENIMRTYIPLLDCYWNDVLMFCIVDPSKIMKAWAETGHEMARPGRWYRIDAEKLEPEKTAIFLYQNDFNQEYGYKESEFVPFSSERYKSLTYFHEKTLAHYAEYPKKVERLLLYYWLPHVFYKGTIPFSDLELCEYSI